MQGGQQDQTVALITPVGQAQGVNSFSYQELKGLKHFHSDTRGKWANTGWPCVTIINPSVLVLCSAGHSRWRDVFSPRPVRAKLTKAKQGLQPSSFSSPLWRSAPQQIPLPKTNKNLHVKKLGNQCENQAKPQSKVVC